MNATTELTPTQLNKLYPSQSTWAFGYCGYNIHCIYGPGNQYWYAAFRRGCVVADTATTTVEEIMARVEYLYNGPEC